MFVKNEFIDDEKLCELFNKNKDLLHAFSYIINDQKEKQIENAPEYNPSENVTIYHIDL